MKVIFGIEKITKYRKPVVALGVFDGLHIGHRRILKEAVRISRRIKGTSAVVTFWPHPQKQASIYSLEHRLSLLEEIGIELCIVIRFNKAFSKLTAEGFIKDILIKKVGARYVCVGRNFRFGRNAKGDFNTLVEFSKVYDFKLKIFNVLKANNKPVSSTYIRKLITKGSLMEAQRLLSRPVSVLGTVVRGVSLAKRLGFPTANVDPHHEVLPPQGVYAVKVLFNNGKFRGVCFIGRKPEFIARMMKMKNKQIKTREIEVHIFGFNKNIYGKNIEIQFIKKTRAPKKFTSTESLARQVRKDILQVKTNFPG